MAEERRLLDKKLSSDHLIGSRSRSLELARRHFAMLESCLDRPVDGPMWLSNTGVTKLVADALHYRDGKQYRLDAFSIMPNHVHIVFQPSMREELPESLSSIMHSLKRNTAKRANEVLGRSGTFWEHETYIRNQGEWKRIVRYVLNNPVKAGLVRTWQEWPWNYVRDAEEIGRKLTTCATTTARLRVPSPCRTSNLLRMLRRPYARPPSLLSSCGDRPAQ